MLAVECKEGEDGKERWRMKAQIRITGSKTGTINGKSFTVERTAGR